MNLSLRTQLVFWLGLSVLVLILVVTFLTQGVMVWNMERSIDDTLQKRAHMIAAIVSSDITTDEASYAQVISDLAKQELPFIPLLLRLISPGGKVIVEFGEVSAKIAENLDYQLQLPGVSGGYFDTIKPNGVTRLRVYTISIPDPRTGETLAFVQDVESLEQVAQATRQMWQNGIIAGLGGSLVVIAVGLVLIRRGFRSLRSILQTVDAVDYSHLKARMQKEARPAELEQLAKSLTAMWQRLDTAVSDREKFFRSVSHDLRTPLAALQGHIELLRRQPSLTEEAKSSIQHMRNETRRLTRLVNNLLLNVQLESKPALATGDISLRGLLDEVVGDMWILAEGLQFNVVAPRDVTVYGDRDLLKQMLLNIVDNAIKFTPKGGKVKLMLISEADWAVLEVSDTGRGVPSEELSHITEAFYASKASRRPVAEGVGLGLSIVKQITELHGGQLEIQSQEGVGTTVRVHLPIRDLQGAPVEKPGV